MKYRFRNLNTRKFFEVKATTPTFAARAASRRTKNWSFVRKKRRK